MKKRELLLTLQAEHLSFRKAASLFELLDKIVAFGRALDNGGCQVLRLRFKTGERSGNFVVASLELLQFLTVPSKVSEYALQKRTR